MWLGWGEDPQQPFIVPVDPWHPVQQAGEDKPHLCAHTTDRWCLFVHEDMAVERSGWLWGHGCGTGVGPRAVPRSGMAAGAEECAGAARPGMGGRGELGFISRSNLAAISRRQSLAGSVLPIHPAQILHSCLASHPRSPRLRHCLLPELPNASSCCLRLLPFPSPPWERCLKALQHPQGPSSHRPSSTLVCTHSTPKNFGVLAESPVDVEVVWVSLRQG